MLAESGVNIIIDHLFLNNGKPDATGVVVLRDCVESFWDMPVLFVRVDCDYNELDRRERWRGDRGVGTAKWQLNELYPKHTYDMTVNTSALSTICCAEEITRAVSNVNSRLFVEMKSKIDAGLEID